MPRGAGYSAGEDELGAVINAVPHILFFKDTELRYWKLNAEFEKAFHIDLRAAECKTDLQLFGPDLHARFVSQDHELITSGLARTYDQEMVIDGVVRTIRSRKRPVYDRRGRLRGIVGMAIDVAEEKAMQR